MFAHIYSYRLKSIVRDKQTMFWTLMFPILLATLFYLSLSNITSTEIFKGIKIAVVDNEEYKENTAFREVLQSISVNDQDEVIDRNSEKLFNVKFTSKSDADELLENSEIDGYIHFDDGIKLVVKKSGLNQTFIKGFLDDYNQTTSTVSNIIRENPTAIQNGLLNDISDRKEYLKEIPASKASPDTTVHYFYTLIAMACLYGSFWGLKEVMAIQGNLSAQGARVNLAPTHKLKVFFVSMLAAVTVQLSEILVLLLYLVFVLNVDFGVQTGYVILTCIIGTCTGVTFGACIAAVVKKGEGMKVGILIGGSMAMSFLAGMMYANMKLIINSKAPILRYLNPANLISDSLYSLYFYDTHTQLFINLLLLCCITVVFSLITYFVLRRQRYASI